MIGVAEGSPLSPAAATIDEAGGGRIGRMLESRDVATGLGKTTFIHEPEGIAAKRVLAVGLGKPDKLTLARLGWSLRFGLGAEAMQEFSRRN